MKSAPLAGRCFGGSGHTDVVVSVAFSPDGTQAISASWDKTVRLWDVESGRELRALTGHNWLIHSVAFSPDGRYAIYGSEDQTVRLWDVGTGQFLLAEAQRQNADVIVWGAGTQANPIRWAGAATACYNRSLPSGHQPPPFALTGKVRVKPTFEPGLVGPHGAG